MWNGKVPYMKTDLIIKIIKGFINIADKFKIKKKITMSENKNINNNQKSEKKTTVINSNTIIQFTFKGFISTMLTILGIFFGFYKLVIQPDIQQTAVHQKEIYIQQKKYMDVEFENLKNAIQINTNAIKANNDRFRDLNESVEEISNSSGSLSGTISLHTNPNESAVNDDALATIKD